MEADTRIRKITNQVTIFMALTYVLAYISPIRYYMIKTEKLTILVVLYIISFYCGAITGIKKKSRLMLNYNEFSITSGLKICIVCLLIYTIVSTINNMAATGTRNLGSAIVMSLSNANKVYYARAEIQSSTIMNYIAILGSPIFVYASVFGLMKFNDLNKGYKAIYIAYLIFEALKWMFVGTNKGIFDIAILFIIVLLLFNKKQPSKRKNITKIIVVAIFAYVAIWFFGYTMQSRLGSRYEMLGSVTYRINHDHFLFKILPQSIVYLFVRIIDYLIQGYYGFSLGLSLDWKPTFLAGSNVFLRGYLQPIVGMDIKDKLYQTRIENIYGWGAESRWHTMYLWLANDFSFIGVILVMGLIGFVFGRCLTDGLKYKNPYALCLAYLLIKAMFYSSANNQILGTYSIVTVVIFFILWKKRRKLVFRFGKKRA